MIYNIDSAYNNDDSIIFVVLTILVTATIIIECFIYMYIYIFIYIYLFNYPKSIIEKKYILTKHIM